jgi:hypothetical protein
VDIPFTQLASTGCGFVFFEGYMGLANLGDDKDSKIAALTSGMASIVAHPRFSRPLEFKRRLLRSIVTV